MVRSAAALMTADGIAATTLIDVVTDSGASRGSVYHYFPEGKKQLIEEAIQWSSDRMLAVSRGTSANTPSEVMNQFIDLWRQGLESTDGVPGYLVANAVFDLGTDDVEAIAIIRETVRSWIRLLAEQLAGARVPPDRAAAIAQIALTCMEGAIIMCRVEGDTSPLDCIAAELLQLLTTVADFHDE
jgi:TetR/AcrR family transcriptional repressor of lmrAB and yxaGH operons